jgi:serine/threonine-protein kinase
MRAPTFLHAPVFNRVDRVDLVELGGGRRVRSLDVLGKGSSSVVHRALLESPNGLRRLVALKLLDSVASDEAEQVHERVAQVASRSAAVRHPNVVDIYDFGQHGTQPFFVTELVEGVSLHTLLARYAEKERRLPLDLALFIGCEIAEALSGARTAKDARGMQVGLLHLGLGPRKVLLGWRGEVKVTDFEASMARGASSGVRTLRAVGHRTATMAPEVAQGARGDSRSDVFSLGIVLRELLVGPRFGPGVSNTEAARLAREGFVQPIAFQPHLPETLVRIMLRALRLEPAERYPNASAMSFELRRAALALGVGDGRMFLRRALDREWGNDASEATAERTYLPTPPPPARSRPSPVQPEDLGDLVDLVDLVDDP